jgi:hypothetical protein
MLGLFIGNSVLCSITIGLGLVLGKQI